MSKNTKQYKKGLVALVLIIVFVVLAVIGSVFYMIYKDNKASSSNGNPSVSSVIQKSNNLSRSDYLAVLYVEGTIQPEGDSYNQAWILNNIAKFKRDSKNKGIILFINSPGGTVYESDETYLALQDYKTTGKKVYAYMGSIAASGGYYIACAAESIYANRNTLTGSIGVIAGNFIDITDFLEDHGIYYSTIHAGKNKNMGNYNERVTDEQISIMQSIADECYDQFTSIVSTSRHIPYKEILPLCDGRVYTATQALKNNLIDGIGTWDNFLDFVYGKNEELENCKLITYRYEKEKGFLASMVSSKLGNLKTESLEGIPSALWEQMNMKGPLYLYK